MTSNYFRNRQNDLEQTNSTNGYHVGGGGQPEKRRKKTMSILGFYRGGSSFFDLNFIWV